MIKEDHPQSNPIAVSQEHFKSFLELAHKDAGLQSRINQASDIDEIEFIAKQMGFSVSTSDLLEWHDLDECTDGFEEDLFMVIQMYVWRGVGKECDPEWKQAAMRAQRRHELGLE